MLLLSKVTFYTNLKKKVIKTCEDKEITTYLLFSFSIYCGGIHILMFVMLFILVTIQVTRGKGVNLQRK